MVTEAPLRARRYVFVVGTQRSGTTLIGQILGAHPHAVLLDEDNGAYDLIEKMMSESEDDGEVFRRCLLSARSMYVGADRFTAQGALGDSVTHLVFKSPNTTYDYARLREIHHSGLHFVFAVRDVRDVVSSMQRLVHIPMVENQVRRISRHQELATRFSEDLRIIESDDTPDHVRKAKIWKIKTGLFSEFTRQPLNALLVRYEDLVSEPDRWIRLMIDHVGLAPAGHAALRHEDVFRGLGPGFTVRNREIDKASLGRWKRQLSREQEHDIWREAGGLMLALGYRRRLSSDRESVERASREGISRPFVATGRGGSGTRLLSLVLQEHGIFLGNRLNESEDSVEWIDLIYELTIKALTEKLPPNAYWRRELIARAESILTKGRWEEKQPWGWKLPETMLILPQVAEAFPGAKFIHLVRHPLDACLRRTHMTSRLDNPIGEATLAAAYRWLNWDRDPRGDDDYLRNAASWIYQVDRAVHLGRSLGAERWLDIRYEDLCDRPQAVCDRIAAFLRVPAITTSLERRIDHARRRGWRDGDERASEVWSICEKTAALLRYRYPD